MKLKTTTILAVTSLSMGVAQAATTIDSIGVGGTAAWDSTTTTTDGSGNGTVVYSLSGTVIEGAETINFNYDLTLVGTGLAGSTTWPSVLGAGQIGAGAGRLATGDTLTFNIAVTSDDNASFDVNFDGYTGFVVNNWVSGEIWDIDGTNFDGNTTFGIIVGNGMVATVESAGNGLSFNSVSYQFSTVAVPEPSSTALLGLGGLALILRRRK